MIQPVGQTIEIRLFVDSYWLPNITLENKISYYYMASSPSGQDEPNPLLWLITRAEKMELACLQETFRWKPCIVNPSLATLARVKMAGYWPRPFLGTSTAPRSISTRKNIDQYPAILTSLLVNNPDFQRARPFETGSVPSISLPRSYRVKILPVRMQTSHWQWIKILTLHSKTFLPIPDCFVSWSMRCRPLLFLGDIVQ